MSQTEYFDWRNFRDNAIQPTPNEKEQFPLSANEQQAKKYRNRLLCGEAPGEIQEQSAAEFS